MRTVSEGNSSAIFSGGSGLRRNRKRMGFQLEVEYALKYSPALFTGTASSIE